MVRFFVVFSLLTTFLFSQKVSITGAGATFVFPLISNLSKVYMKDKSDISINYQSIGSGGGIRQFINKTIDFGASESPIPKEQLEQNPDALHIPITIGGVVIAYNIPEIKEKELRITPDVLVKIYLGEIKKWNDEGITELNPDLSLPDK